MDRGNTTYAKALPGEPSLSCVDERCKIRKIGRQHCRLLRALIRASHADEPRTTAPNDTEETETEN